MEYAMWRACERFGVRPPRVKASWDDMEDDMIIQSMVIAYNQIREIEEDQRDAALAGVKI